MDTRSLLEEAGVAIITETATNYLCLCIFHDNSSTPAMSVSKDKGLFLCLNGACDARGTIVDILKHALGLSTPAARRMTKREVTYEKLAEVLLPDESSYKSFDKELLEEYRQAFWKSSEAQSYFKGRGFKKNTAEKFGVGYREDRDLITVPLHSPYGEPVGYIGRGVGEHRFKNSYKLPTNETFFNIINARKQDTAYVMEASFDVMRLDQTGFENGLGVLKSKVSDVQVSLLNRYFTNIVIMTDDDHKNAKPDCDSCQIGLCFAHNAGRALGNQIVKRLPNKNVSWAVWDYKQPYPHGAKDAGECTDSEIRKIAQNTISNFEFRSWYLS